MTRSVQHIYKDASATRHVVSDSEPFPVRVVGTGASAAAMAAPKTADFDSGAGTDTVQVVGIALPASGGAVAGGTSTNPVRVDPTGTTTQPMSVAGATRSDTFAATGNGTTVTATTAPKQNFALQVVQTDTVDAWTVLLEGSLDNSTFSTLISHTEADGTGTMKQATGKPCLYYRTRCSALTLGAGTNVVATILAMQ